MGRKKSPRTTLEFLERLSEEWKKAMMRFRWNHPELHNVPFKDPEKEQEFRELYPVCGEHGTRE